MFGFSATRWSSLTRCRFPSHLMEEEFVESYDYKDPAVTVDIFLDSNNMSNVCWEDLEALLSDGLQKHTSPLAPDCTGGL